MKYLLSIETDTQTYILWSLAGLVVMIAIYYVLNRWVFAVKRQLWNQQQQINLLIKIAKQLGVTEDLKAIEDKNNNPV